MTTELVCWITSICFLLLYYYEWQEKVILGKIAKKRREQREYLEHHREHIERNARVRAALDIAMAVQNRLRIEVEVVRPVIEEKGNWKEDGF